jgi:putative RNA 2'-phosphotransferase
MPTDAQISKFMSYVLRHAPHKLDLELDPHGWTDYAQFSDRLCARLGVCDGDIRRVIAENAKRRFTLEDGRIRAVQGHSIDVDLALEAITPPRILYHGTTAAAWEEIQTSGLKPMQRNHVHLSPDLETAGQVAMRRLGPHMLLTVDAPAMAVAGYAFFRADNGVWLTAIVPPDYLSPVTEPVL